MRLTITTLSIGLCVSMAAAADPGSDAAKAEKLQPAPVSAPRSYGIYEYRAGELHGRKLYRADGTLVGEIDQLVIGKRDWRLFAVVDSGGFLGIGANTLAVPLELIVERDQRLTISEAASRRAASKAAYISHQYMPVASRQLLRPLALRRLRDSDEQLAASAFDRADQDGDGLISVHEWALASRDGSGWGPADHDQNGHLDRVEFSAFETATVETDAADSADNNAKASKLQARSK